MHTHKTIAIGVILRTVIVTLALIFVVFVQQLPVDAQGSMDQEICANELAIYSSDVSVEACTSLILGVDKTSDELAVSFTYRCRNYLDEKQIDRAIQDCDEAIWLDHKNSLAYETRGHAYEQGHQYRRAVADFAQVVALQPSNLRGWEGLCESQLELGQTRLAKSACDEALRLRSKD